MIWSEHENSARLPYNIVVFETLSSIEKQKHQPMMSDMKYLPR